MKIRILALVALVALCAGSLLAQGNRPASPRGQAATQVAGEGTGRSYTGKWIEVDYGRPVLRTRQGIFGTEENYGKKVNAGAPVWRAGANQSTRLMTEVDLTFGEQTLKAGEYSLFIELKSPTEWTLIISSWGAQQTFDRDNKDALWGSYGYSSDKDVLRATMQVAAIPVSVDELTIGFVDVTNEGGTLALWWDTTMASVAFGVAE